MAKSRSVNRKPKRKGRKGSRKWFVGGYQA